MRKMIFFTLCSFLFASFFLTKTPANALRIPSDEIVIVADAAESATTTEGVANASTGVNAGKNEFTSSPGEGLDSDDLEDEEDGV